MELFLLRDAQQGEFLAGWALQTPGLLGSLIPSLLAGLILGLLAGFLAWKAGALTAEGALAAALTGAVIFGLGGLDWAALLLLFFISSSGLSRLFASRKAAAASAFAKGSRRDWAQVLANGGLPSLLVLGYFFFPGDRIWWAAFAGGLAAVNADTWATELGVLSPVRPVLITSGRPVEGGTSGAVSTVGSLAALAGAMLVASAAALLTPGGGGLPVLLAATAGGVAGAFLDSLLGATIQAVYWCPACHKETERHPVHVCGTGTVLRRGWRMFGNDLVNLFCSAAGAAVSAALWRMIA